MRKPLFTNAIAVASSACLPVAGLQAALRLMLVTNAGGLSHDRRFHMHDGRVRMCIRQLFRRRLAMTAARRKKLISRELKKLVWEKPKSNAGVGWMPKNANDPDPIKYEDPDNLPKTNRNRP